MKSQSPLRRLWLPLASAACLSLSTAATAAQPSNQSALELAASPSTAENKVDLVNKAAAPEGYHANGAYPGQADTRFKEWLGHGRDYAEQRHSPLTQINSSNVDQLGLSWSYDLGVSRGIEVTPLVIDGVMYVTGTWNIVHALDAKTGEWLWKYDPEVDRSRAQYLCCDAVNRGLAVWENTLFMGTIDGRLIALDRKTGKEKWDIVTIDASKPYTITGAPRVIKGKVIIGNGGAEFGARGYISAYDAGTGKQLWRFYTVPGNPNLGFENDVMKMAADTWKGEWWKYGGGGTVWDSMAYDPELDLLYIGVGNGSPWNQAIRSPGGGDNLFLSSIVAVKPDTGEYVWHYQTTPGETWDYTATQHIILAELEIDNKSRKVLMQAPKNGFFYVLDRETGELISAENYVPVTWATHIDKTTGRPVEAANARWGNSEPTFTLPGPFGGHNWQPMSYSPQTGLVYIPAMETPHIYAKDQNFKFQDGLWNTGSDMSLGSLPTGKAQLAEIKKLVKGRLLAWNPVTQKAAWKQEHNGAWNGGVLSTAGNIVVQGNGDAEIVAYNAQTGERLWSFFAQTGVVAPPISYQIDDEQYITVAAGWGGAFALTYGGVLPAKQQIPAGRILTFKLDGKAKLPDLVPMPSSNSVPPALTASPQTVADGHAAYIKNCFACHGDHAQSAGTIPNLRHTPLLASPEAWRSIVIDGVLQQRGMPKFGKLISPETADAIRAYIIFEARSGRDGNFYRGED